METEQKTFNSVGEALTDFNRRLLELESDMHELDVAMEVIYSLFFSLGVKPASIPELADRIREQHNKERKEIENIASPQENGIVVNSTRR